MKHHATIALYGLVAFALAISTPAFATDVDGPNDCMKSGLDFGDAPETVDAYPGVPGKFPTCLQPGPIGTQELACPPISSLPGPAGYVMHMYHPGGFWLGCTPLVAPLGIDPESDGKMSLGTTKSACNPSIVTDCFESAFGLTWGQDECYGTNDAGIASFVTFTSCSTGVVSFRTYNCSSFPVSASLNILVDWNQDGDWNDNFICPALGACAYEWAVKNVPISLPPGCNTLTSPQFRTGPATGHGWMRITIGQAVVSDDFPWAGTAMTGEIALGETEDYPVDIREPI